MAYEPAYKLSGPPQEAIDRWNNAYKESENKVNALRTELDDAKTVENNLRDAAQTTTGRYIGKDGTVYTNAEYQAALQTAVRNREALEKQVAKGEKELKTFEKSLEAYVASEPTFKNSMVEGIVKTRIAEQRTAQEEYDQAFADLVTAQNQGYWKMEWVQGQFRKVRQDTWIQTPEQAAAVDQARAVLEQKFAVLQDSKEYFQMAIAGDFTSPRPVSPESQPGPVSAPTTVNQQQLAQAGIGGNIDYEALARGQRPTTPAPTLSAGQGQLSAEAIRYLQAMSGGQKTTTPTTPGAPIAAPSTANATQLAQAGIGGAIDYEALIAGQATGTTTTGTTTTGTTTTGMGGGGGGGGGSAPAPAPAPIVLSAEAQRYLKSLARTAWLDTANTRFGWVAQLYDTDPSIKALMDRAVTQGYTPNRFAAELRNTSWWKNTSASVRSYMGLQATDPAALQEQVNKLKPEIRNQASTLGLSLDEATITKLANDGVKYGWTQTQVANHIGAEAIKEDRLAGGMAGGSQELSNATALQNIRNIANDYMIDVTDQEFNQFTRQILSGKKTEQDFTNLMKSRAKLQYSGLTENIDRGETVRGATESYRNIAANLLEITPDEVNFSDEKFAPAFNFVDDATKKPRQMNMQEWAQYIRSTPDWQQTENARNTYREAAFTLARSFGMYQ